MQSRMAPGRALIGATALLLAACTPSAPPAPTAPARAVAPATSPAPSPLTSAPATQPAASPATSLALAAGGLGPLGTGSGKVYYADSRTWPSQGDRLRPLATGRFYVSVQDDGLIAVIDPEKAPDYLVKTIKVDPAQPHHLWTAPGMRYIYVNYQSEGKGDHNKFSVIDTFTDKVTDLSTDFDDPFHCSYNSVRSDLLLCGDLNPKGGYVYYFDAANQQYLGKVKTTGTTARDVIQTHDGKFAFVGQAGEGVDVLDIEQAKIIKTIPCKGCAKLKMTPDGKQLFASSTSTDTALIIDVQKQEIAQTVTFPKASGPGNINFAANGAVAMIGLGTSGKLALVDVAKGALTNMLDSGKATNTAYPNPVVPNVAIATNDGTDDWYTVLDAVEGRVIETIEAGGKGTHNVQWSPDGKYAVGGDRLGDTATLFRWNESTKKVEKVSSIQIGFGANGVQWVPNFCGVPYLTQANLSTAKNQPAKNAQGDC